MQVSSAKVAMKAGELESTPKGAQIAAERRDKIRRLRESGIDSFPRSFPDRTDIATIHAVQGAQDNTTIRAAGRLIAQRHHGGIVFMDIRDSSGEIEVLCLHDELGEEEFGRIGDIDIGDIIGVEGSLAMSKRDTRILRARSLTILGKALMLPPPPGAKRRGRSHLPELDMIAGDGYRTMLRTRKDLMRFLRQWFDNKGFLEVETPLLLPFASGAAAQPFVTHGNALGESLYLRVEIEQSLKRLLVGGIENVYELGRCFRNEGMSKRHHFEFTLLEWLQGYAEYHDTMDLIETVVSAAAKELFGTHRFVRNGRAIDLTPPWRRITVREAIIEKTDIDIVSADQTELMRMAGNDSELRASWANMVAWIFAKMVEPNIVEPTFVIDFPGELFPTAKRHTKAPEFAESFEAIVGGVEISSGATNVNDHDEQRMRFAEQQARKKNPENSDGTLTGMNEVFLRAVAHGMMPLSGAGLGIDRILMLLTERDSLRQAIPFPTL